MSLKTLVCALLAGMLLSSCASHQAFRDAEEALKNKNWDVAVAEYSRALSQNPNSPEIKMKLNMAKIFAARTHYEQAKRLLEAKDMEKAVIELEVASDLDPENKAVQDELDRVKQEILHPAAAEQPRPAERPMSELPTVALQPEFQPKSDVPIELKFKDTSLKEVLLTLGKVGDVNVLFDKDFKDIPVSFDFVNTTFLQALDTVLTSTHNFFKVIGKNTLIIAPDTPAKRAEYEETVSRTFYLSNADVEEIARTLRNVLGIQMIATNARLNTVTIKDRITRVVAASKIVSQLDKAKPEVVVDVEILEVNRTRFQQYGLQIASTGAEGIQTSLANTDKFALDAGPILARSNFFITTFPNATFRALRRWNDTRLLASLPLRTVVGETGRVRFGSQVPVPQTTFAPIASGGVNQQPITSFIYRDVGINIDITPRVHLDGDVTLEVVIESSSISGQGYANLPQFSTSRVEKTIRLKEGETNIIAGLIRDDERKSMSGLPLIGKIPILGKLFAENEHEITETDVVLALSPHIIRELKITPEDEKMLWLGIDEQQQGPGNVFRPYVPSIPYRATPQTQPEMQEQTEEEPEETEETETPEDYPEDQPQMGTIPPEH
jgi:general secretion pathway protein D